MQAAAPSVLSTYLAAGVDVGHTLRVMVLATNRGQRRSRIGAHGDRRRASHPNKIAPLVLGLPVTGQTLTATEGTRTGTEPISYSFHWQRCTKAGSDAKTSPATKSSHVIADGDAGNTLRVIVTAKNEQYVV